MPNGRFSVPEPKDKKEKEIFIQSLPFVKNVVFFSEEQRKAIHQAAMVAAQLTNFDVELFEKNLYEVSTSDGPRNTMRKIKKMEEPNGQ